MKLYVKIASKKLLGSCSIFRVILFIIYLLTDHTRLSVWVLDGDPGHTNLLKFALNEDTFPHTLVIFTIAMTTPWGILDQLQSWASMLGDHIDSLDLTPGKFILIICISVCQKHVFFLDKMCFVYQCFGKTHDIRYLAQKFKFLAHYMLSR